MTAQSAGCFLNVLGMASEVMVGSVISRLSGFVRKGLVYRAGSAPHELRLVPAKRHDSAIKSTNLLFNKFYAVLVPIT